MTYLDTSVALHLASMMFLRERGDDVTVATYDDRLAGAARALGFTAMDG